MASAKPARTLAEGLPLPPATPPALAKDRQPRLHHTDKVPVLGQTPSAHTAATPPIPPLIAATAAPALRPSPDLGAAEMALPLGADPLGLSRTEGAGPHALHHQTQTPAATRMDLPQHVARQIADVLQHLPNRPVEISLSPEELGRVRLAVSTSEAGLVVSVVAERAETIDLMRRHIASLQSAFQDIGYDDIAFSFSGSDQAQDDPDPPPDAATSAALTAEDGTAQDITRITLTTGPAAGLDLRL